MNSDIKQQIPLLLLKERLKYLMKASDVPEAGHVVHLSLSTLDCMLPKGTDSVLLITKFLGAQQGVRP